MDSDPIKHVENITWGRPWEVRAGGTSGPPLVFIGGLWGTVCLDGFSTTAAEFFCRNLLSGGDGIAPISHEQVRYPGKPDQQLPVLLTDVQCDENAVSVADCTSGPMGYSNCPSGDDVYLSCGFWYVPPTDPSK